MVSHAQVGLLAPCHDLDVFVVVVGGEPMHILRSTPYFLFCLLSHRWCCFRTRQRSSAGSRLSDVRMVEESQSMKDACKIMLEPLTKTGRIRTGFGVSLLGEARAAGRGEKVEMVYLCSATQYPDFAADRSVFREALGVAGAFTAAQCRIDAHLLPTVHGPVTNVCFFVSPISPFSLPMRSTGGPGGAPGGKKFDLVVAAYSLSHLPTHASRQELGP